MSQPSPGRRRIETVRRAIAIVATCLVGSTACLAGGASASVHERVTYEPVPHAYLHPVASRAYLRFHVRGLERRVERATLEVFTTARPRRSKLGLRRVSPKQWRKLRRAQRSGRRLSAAPSRRVRSSGSWISVDATRLVAGNGRVSLAVTVPRRPSRRAAARASAPHAARLVIEQRAARAGSRPGEAAPTPTVVAPQALAPAAQPVAIPPQAAGPISSPTSAAPGASAPAPPAPSGPSPTGHQLGGVQVHPLWGGSSVADFDRELDMAKAAGADSVRMDLSWSSLETDAKGDWSSWYVEKADIFFEHARARGLKVIATLWSTPCWASTAPESLKQGCTGAWWDRDVHVYAPADPDDYADAAEWVARRWGGALAALEVWNEPNLDFSLKAADPAGAYAGMLKAAYPRIKAAAPDVTVLGGSLAFSDGDFLTELYDRHGIAGHYDAISYHPYNEWRDPDDLWQLEWRKYSYQLGTEWVRAIMVAHGDADVDLWMTEVGFSTCSPHASRWCVSEAQQAEYIEDSFRIARERWPFVKAVIAYNLRNKGSAPDDRESQFGLLHRDFTPKPGYEALKRALAPAG